MLRKIFLLTLLIYISMGAKTQDISPELPQMFPVPPDAAGLMKVGLAQINKPIGAATAKIDLYNIKLGNFNLPISLNYFSQGNKAEELTSRVGYGWSLLAGGVINRKVLGVPDELGTISPKPINLALTNQENLDYCGLTYDRGAPGFGQDTQPDEYFFSFNGYYGKFVFSDDGEPVIISHQNLKISGSAAGTFIISTPDGIKYHFGGFDAYERVQSTGFAGNGNIKTVFNLFKIDLPSGQFINFDYQRIQTNSISGLTQTIMSPGSCQDTADAMQIGAINQNSFSFQYAVNDACFLKDITTSEGLSIHFFYEMRPDYSNDNRLIGFEVKNQNLTTVKKFSFEYQTPPGYVNTYRNGYVLNSLGRNGRFYLHKVNELYVENGQSEKLTHTIDYEGDVLHENLESAFSQDLYGFKNGKINSWLIPYPPPNFYTPEVLAAHPWADRSPNWHASVEGMIKTIHYPTKGKEDFFYELNTISVFKSSDIRTMSKTIYGGDYPVTSYQYLTVLKDQKIYVNFSQVLLDPLCAAVCDGCKFIQLIIKDETTNSPVRNYFFYGLPFSNYDSIPVIADHQYSFKYYLFPSIASCNRATIQVTYDAAPPGGYQINEEIGGVRVRKITQTDQFNAKLDRFYFYAPLNDISRSCGIAATSNYFISQRRHWYVSGCTECTSYLLSSNGIFNLLQTENSHIFYPYVIESSDSLFANGCTENQFYLPITTNYSEVKRNSLIPYPPSGIVATYEGMNSVSKVYDNTLNLKKKTENNYEIVTLGKYVRSIYVRWVLKIYCFQEDPNNPIWVPYTPENFLAQYDIRESVYSAGWVRLQSSKNTDYDDLNHPFETFTNYVYGSPDNVLPSAIQTTDSKSIQQQTLNKYPTDFPADPVSAAMIAANIITPVIEQSKVRGVNNSELSKLKVQYQDNGNTGGGLLPSIIKQKETAGNVMEDKILFSAYDSKGNILEVSKALDGKISYIWDYNQSLVTAEVKNAAKGNIAFTSFEADSKGNFLYAGSPSFDLSAPTGKKVYDATTQPVAFPASLDLNKSYIVSYWNKSASPYTLSGTTTVTNGRNVSGWYYHEHTVNNMPYGSTISGGYIDELRVYPSDAMMTTFTYEPLIGQTSACDVNNRITYYEYDGMNRLSLIRNRDKNIVKKICYNYAGMPEDCSGITSYRNVVAQRTATRSNCGEGLMGTAYTYTVTANTYTATSQVAADQLATDDLDANTQAQANLHGSCVPVQYGNQYAYRYFYRNNCGTGYAGSLESVPVAANTYFAATQAAANQLAEDYLTTYGQGIANTTGTCSPYTCSTGNCAAPANKCINNVCEAGVRHNVATYRLKINGVWHWYCTYKYCFSDATASAEITEESTDACTLLLCESDM